MLQKESWWEAEEERGEVHSMQLSLFKEVSSSFPLIQSTYDILPDDCYRLCTNYLRKSLDDMHYNLRELSPQNSKTQLHPNRLYI